MEVTDSIVRSVCVKGVGKNVGGIILTERKLETVEVKIKYVFLGGGYGLWEGSKDNFGRER